MVKNVLKIIPLRSKFWKCMLYALRSCPSNARGPEVRIHNEASLILNSTVLAIMEVLSRGIKDINVKPTWNLLCAGACNMNRTQLGQIQIEALTGSIYECWQNVATQNNPIFTSIPRSALHWAKSVHKSSLGFDRTFSGLKVIYKLMNMPMLKTKRMWVFIDKASKNVKSQHTLLFKDTLDDVSYASMLWKQRSLLYYLCMQPLHSNSLVHPQVPCRPCMHNNVP